MNLNPENSALIISFVMALVSVAGAITTIYMVKPERKKKEAEASASIADAAESVAAGAKINNEQLLKRIEEMEVREVKRERELSIVKNELQQVRADLVEWKDYAFRLSHQVKSLGAEPVPFKPYPQRSLSE